MKVSLSAAKFHPKFQKLVTELGRYGLAKGDTELLLAYLNKVGVSLKKMVLQDKREYARDNDSSEVHAAKACKEPYRVVMELEALDTSAKAIVAPVMPKVATAVTNPSSGRWKERPSNSWANEKYSGFWNSTTAQLTVKKVNVTTRPIATFSTTE